MNPVHLKLLAVGDGAVGKSSLLIAYATGRINLDYIPTVFDNFTKNEILDGREVTVGLWDTAGQEDYDRLRPLSYPQTDVFLICFAINRPTSLQNIIDKWIPELDHHAPGITRVLVGCKADLRSTCSTECITTERIKEVAKSLGANYCETSVLTMSSIRDCFSFALREALKPNTQKRILSLFKRKSKFEKPEPIAPVMPPAGKAPSIEIQTSIFADQMKGMLESPSHTDVIFVIENTHRIEAHRIVLCSASKFFQNVFGVKDKKVNQLKAVVEPPVTREQLTQGLVPGIATLYEEVADGKTKHVIEISSNISSQTFIYVLQFLYTGDPHLKSNASEQDLLDLTEASDIFHLSYLRTICINVQIQKEYLNPSIGTFLNDETGKNLKDLFFNKDLFADVVFDIEGDKVYSHKSILSARCTFMEAMFGISFSEGISNEVKIRDVSTEVFLAVLEYLYTDHSPIEDGDSVGIMVLADLYSLPRLVNLCELYITKEVDRSVAQNILNSEIDVIGLLLTSQRYNACQLDQWCLHFIASNYLIFEQRKEFPYLTGENLKKVEKNRWPPVSYLLAVKEYEKELISQGSSKCSIM